MATVKPTGKTTQAAPADVGAQSHAAIEEAKGGNRLLRPFKYAWAFAAGTVHDGLNGIAKWGVRGLKLGLVAAAAVWMAPAVALMFGATVVTSVSLVGLVATGFVGGMAIGGTHGLLTGGMKAVGRLHRSEVYADDLIVRSKIQRDAPHNRADYRAASRNRAQAANTLWIMEREKEAARDANTYWQDREHANTNVWGRGM